MARGPFRNQRECKRDAPLGEPECRLGRQEHFSDSPKHPPTSGTSGPREPLPSVLILRAVLTRANRVALNMTVPSLFRGMFIDTRRWRERRLSQ